MELGYRTLLASLTRRLREESGVALLVALVALSALGAGVVTVAAFSTTAGHTAVRASADQQAYAYAEAGINSAMAVLADPTTNALDPTVLPAPPPDPAAQRDDYGTGYVLWGGTLDTTTSQWTITAIGYAPNPAGPNLPDRWRKLTATTQVLASLTQPLNNQVWNYIYAWKTGGPNVCDVTVDNNVNISASLYVEGNLCLSNNATVTQQTSTPPTPANVVVKGKLAIANNGWVGTASNPVNELHVVGGCGSSLSSVHTCSPTTDPINAGVLDSNPPPITPPTPDWTGWYQDAGLGPYSPCPAGSLNPPTFDVDTNLDLSTNGNAPAFGTSTLNTIDLTPSFSYTCKGADAELSWDASTKVLTVSGVIYFDGNVTVANGAVNEYQGQATIYATGTFTMSNDSMMCGLRTADGTDCDFAAATGWDPNTNMLIVVAHGNDGSGNSVVLYNNAKWEGGLYAYNNMDLVNNAVVEGPMILGGITFTNNLVVKPFPVITSVPLGAPGNPTVYAEPQPPVVSG